MIVVKTFWKEKSLNNEIKFSFVLQIKKNRLPLQSQMRNKVPWPSG